MSIRPIDVITIPPKSQEASTQQQSNQHRLTYAQEQANVQFNKEVQHNTQKTVETNKSEKKEEKYDAKEKGHNTYQKKNSSKKKNEETEEKQIKISNFDIKI